MTVSEEIKVYNNYINGEFVEPSTGKTIDDVDPGTGEVWARVPNSGKEDIEKAISAAKRAQVDWANLTDDVRADYLRKVASVIEKYSEELNSIESRGNGWAIAMSGTIEAIIQYWNDAARQTSIAARGETIKTSATSTGYTMREPLGIVLGIIPFNAPLFTFTVKACYALAAGNSVIIKPSEHASISSLRYAEIIGEVLPPGLVNVITGIGSEMGDDLVEHPDINRVSLTGSGRTAEIIMRTRASNPVPTTLELGGKSPNIVFADADLNKVIDGLTGTMYYGNAGEICTAGSRILVQSSIYDKVVEMMQERLATIKVGHQLDPTTHMGPVANKMQYDRIISYIDMAKDEGARVLFGGRHGGDVLLPNEPEYKNGFYIEPTLLEVKDHSLRICQEEVFGPVAVMMPFETEEEAVELANDTIYGLGSGVWTEDLGRSQRMIRAINAGNVWVNTYAAVSIHLPFGGFNSSGFGKDAILENTREKAVVIETG